VRDTIAREFFDVFEEISVKEGFASAARHIATIANDKSEHRDIVCIL